MRFTDFLKSKALWSSARHAMIWGVLISPFMAFLLNGGLENPGKIFSYWGRNFATVIWATPLIGLVWASSLNFASALLRYYLIPRIPLGWGPLRVGPFCTVVGAAVGISAMWFVIIFCDNVLGMPTVRPDSEWTVSGIAGMLGIVFAHMFFAFHLNEVRMHEAMDRQKELESQRLQGELMNMNMRIRPHFFFNALNTLSSLMEQDSNRAQDFLLDLSDLFRKSFRHGSDGHLCPWKDEYELIEHYLLLESSRFGERLKWNLDVDAEDDAPFPAFFLQPLVENAVHHGLSRLKGPGTLELKGQFKDSRWQLNLTNSVSECIPFQMKEGHALSVLNARAQLLNGELKATCENGEFSVKVTLQIDAL